MEYVALPDVRSNLWSTRRGAQLFLDDPPIEAFGGAVGRHNWIARWTHIGDAHRTFADLNAARGAVDEAREAWLCALTAFEVARRLLDEDDPQIGDLSAKVELSIQGTNLSLEPQVEQVQIVCCDQTNLQAYYLPSSGTDVCAPAVVCISSEQQAGAILLGRLLPEVRGRAMSLLVVSHDHLSNHSRLESEILLSCCLEYLCSRSNVDPSRIGVYGEGLSAALATHFAASDRRVAAAVCDGGLWIWAQAQASIGWLTKAAGVDENLLSARRSRLIGRLRCPVLVVAGGGGIVSISEAMKLQAECTAAGIDLELAIPPIAHTPIGEIENFVTSDDRILGWLEQKLSYTPVP